MQARLRTLIDHVARSAEADAVLLRQFADARDAAAFAELVRRYGRLVWGQCKNLLHSEADADDAFQATFLTLAKSARTVRDAHKLGPWLHVVAYRVCQNAKRLAAHRRKRERAAAAPEAARPVAEAAWDAAFAAVHDELAKLPEPLRAAFVLCVLEGKGTNRAAEQLGLTASTLSTRLGRAKQMLYERLSARELTAGLAAVGAVAVGGSSVPAAVVGKACDLAAGGSVPANILPLSHGVLGMVTMNAKRWVMAALAVGGLTAGLGGVWSANAQQPRPSEKESPAFEKKVLEDLKQKLAAEQEELRARERLLEQKIADEEKARKAAGNLRKSGENERPKEGVLGVRSYSTEFIYFGQKSGYAPTAAELEATVQEVESNGFTFVGVVTMKGQTKGKDGEAVPTLMFRRSAGGKPLGRSAGLDRPVEEGDAARLKRAEEEKVIRDEIDRLNKRLDELRARPGSTPPPVRR